MILDKIIAEKRKELANKPYLNSFICELKKSDRDFKKAISKPGINLIAEIKKGSPSKSVIRKNFNLKEIAKVYDTNKVSAISVLTDEKFFQGKLEYLTKVRALTKKPLLRKDFIIDEYQIYEARHYGADAVLLIAAILTKGQIDRFIDIAKKYNMECLVEVHTSQELKNVLDTKAEIIGINNRNLDSLRIDLNTTLRLVNKVPRNKVIVSESGFETKEDIDSVKGKVNAVLIGTSLMRETDIGRKIDQFMTPMIKVCGITNASDCLASKDADIIGLNFYQKSARFVKKESA
ncbi:MAG: indole-3-glycerol phosphate synthase TrpC, partial [Nanoarchaeota archaeon]|nr:indole-3-glycerol phosphate synthase TrpC [Nanoarchaeota archaeon]